MAEIIALFGATGATGSQVIKHALEQGYKIQALARTPSKIKVEHHNLTVIQGDFENMQAVQAVVKGANYVIVCAGGDITVRPFVPRMEAFVSTKLWPAMKAEPSIKVFLYQAGALSAEPGKKAPFAMRIMMHMASCFVAIKPMVADNDGVIAFINSQQQKPFEVIITLPGGLKEGESTGKEYYGADAPNLGMTTFADLAIFNLKAIKDKSLYGKYPYPAPMKK
jgi:uncharacterized protein